MNPLGWLFMIVSVSFVVILTGWCFYRVLSTHEEPPEPVKGFHSA
jgi:hypothetical protein